MDSLSKNDSPGQVRIVERKTVWKGFIHLEKLLLEQRMPNGEPMFLDREMHDHGNAAAILLYDPLRDTVVMVRQFRLATHLNGGPDFMIEVPAGLLDGEDPQAAIVREAMEETGYKVETARYLFSAYSSPGCIKEKISLFVATVTFLDRVSSGGGLAQEGEDIEVLDIPLDEAFAMIATGGIVDAKTIILLQWAMLNRDALKNGL